MDFDKYEKAFLEYLASDGYSARKDVSRGLECLRMLQNNPKGFTPQDKEALIAAAEIVEKSTKGENQDYDDRMKEYKGVIGDSETYDEFVLKCQTAELPVLSEETFLSEQDAMVEHAIGHEGDLQCKSEGESTVVDEFGKKLSDTFFSKVREGQFDDTYKNFSIAYPELNMSYEDFRNFSENPLTPETFLPEGAVEYAFSQMIDDAKLLYKKAFSYEPRRMEQDFSNYLIQNSEIFADVMYRNFSDYFNCDFSIFTDVGHRASGLAEQKGLAALQSLGRGNYTREDTLAANITDPLHRMAISAGKPTYYVAKAQQGVHEDAEMAWNTEGVKQYRDQVEWAQLSGKKIKNPDDYKKKWLKNYYKKNKNAAKADAMRKADFMGSVSQVGAGAAEVLVRGGVNKLVTFSNSNTDTVNFNSSLAKDAAIGGVIGLAGGGLAGAAKSMLTADKEYAEYAKQNAGNPHAMTSEQFKKQHMLKNAGVGAGIGTGVGIGGGAIKNTIGSNKTSGSNAAETALLMRQRMSEKYPDASTVKGIDTTAQTSTSAQTTTPTKKLSALEKYATSLGGKSMNSVPSNEYGKLRDFINQIENNLGNSGDPRYDEVLQKLGMNNTTFQSMKNAKDTAFGSNTVPNKGVLLQYKKMADILVDYTGKNNAHQMGVFFSEPWKVPNF